jgi:prepilin-type N-terminal cleavage/methylation domain-containing protein
VSPSANHERGVTLIEVLIAVTLLSVLSVGMFQAMEIGLNTYVRSDRRLMENRRVAGAQHIVEEELEGLIPVIATCTTAAGGPGARTNFFQGEAETMRLVSGFSLQQGWRGQPQVLELFVIPGDIGVRLVVNESLYSGPTGAGRFCVAPHQYLPVSAGSNSFVLADKLAYCRFSYLFQSPDPNAPPIWTTLWKVDEWPLAVRIEMAPVEPHPGQVQPITVTAPIRLHRGPEIKYEDLPYQQ